MPSPLSLQGMAKGINKTCPLESTAKLVQCNTTFPISVVCMAVVGVAVVFRMGAVIELAAENSSRSLARGWRVRGESPVRWRINYSSQW